MNQSFMSYVAIIMINLRISFERLFSYKTSLTIKHIVADETKQKKIWVQSFKAWLA